MRRRLAGGLMQFHRPGDAFRRGPLRFDHLDQRHQKGRVPPMRPKRALAPGEPLHDRGDGNDRGVAGEDRVGTNVALDLGEELLLERKILQHRLDHVIGFAHGLA
jgi:hypothetical protein